MDEPPVSWFEQGVTLFEQARYAEAIAAFDKAIAFNENPKEAWFNRGLSHAQTGNYPLALRSFEKTLQLDPSHENAKKARAMVFGLMGTTEEAYAAQQEALKPVAAPRTPTAPPPQMFRPRKREKVRSPALAALFSFFFPGWGQWYDGNRWNGLHFFAALVVLGVADLTLSLLMNHNFLVLLAFLVLGLAIWVYGMYDAYATAGGINRGEVPFDRKSRFFWLPVLAIIGAVVLLAVLLVIFSVGSMMFSMNQAGLHGAGGSSIGGGSLAAQGIANTRVVAATAQQPDDSHILVTYQGGQDADKLDQLIVMVTDSSGTVQSKVLGQPSGTTPLAVGSTATLTGTYSGRDHVMALGKFSDGSMQTVFDAYL
ncbi:MAG TPA: tetratricopeptide repeat protein [Methanoregula sp.]|nr:tetratricopeptide repeat protein [Methanoregula sp.]